jgi:hypothetical protein
MSRAVTTIADFTPEAAEAAKAELDTMKANYRPEKPAEAKLSAMLADKNFLNGIERSSGAVDGVALPSGAAFDKVQSAVADYRAEQGSPVDLAMAGHVGDVNDSDYLHMKLTADALRADGVKEQVIRQVLSGAPVSRAEHDMVAEWKARAEGEREWVAAYLKGDPEKVRQMQHAVIVLASPIKEEAA